MSFVPTHHTNPSFNEALGGVGAQLQEMAELCMNALDEACKSIDSGDREQARAIYAADGRINRLEESVTGSVASILARHNPVAHDLHALMGSLKMSQELERLADHAKNIGRRNARLAERDTEVAFKDMVKDLGRRTRKMFATYLEGIENNDLEKASKAWSMDKGVNSVYTVINTVFIAKNFERIGDKIKNLAEIAHYQKTGEVIDFEEHEDD
ncbi:MAG: hypothetical protein ISN26_05410 [Betaproteobacteria bacterium AqS2]|uniref:PhoU domain-containing protein n=1 Tax=Candidatus Amphirhobacter heronislandensis TaxID=1732024 RepID=A0A930UGZ1_9GAMM|nr:hypothetical protein [Betaproteobacteria bacterium AqS2]